MMLLSFQSHAQTPQEFVPGEVIVKLKGKNSSSGSGMFMGKMQSRLILKGSFPELNMHRYALKTSGDVMKMVQELKADPNVEYAEPNYILRKLDSVDTLADGFNNDNRVFSQADFEAMANGSYVQNHAAINMESSWANQVSLTGNPDRPIVAVIDTGVDYNHSVFANGAIWTNPNEISGNGIDDDGNGYIDDVRGWNFYSNNNNPMDDDEHGTHCAGIVLGATQDIYNQETSKIRIMPLKFLGADGGGTTSGAVAAIYYAVNNGAQVISNSWGGSSYSQALHDALKFAYDRHVVTVAAAGNYNSNNDSSPLYPASYPVPGNISVMATTDYDNKASFSNYGGTSVHIASPGVGIFSTIPGNSYRFMSGTSMAAPLVAGLAAAMLREAPSLTGYQIRKLMMENAALRTGLSGKVASSGRVDALGYVLAAKNQWAVASYQPSYTASGSDRSVASQKTTTTGGGCGTVSAGGAGMGSAWLGKGGGGSSQGMLFAIGLSVLPLIVWLLLRQKVAARGIQRRKSDRFLMNSEIKINADGRELKGQMKTISVGGLSFDAEAMLAKGGVLTIQISSPDGKEQVQVEGHVVWSENNKSYGVAFDSVKRDSWVAAAIERWSKSLVKT